ncbi:MAG: hypothetical protein RDU25_03520 [Patescibacteria group bacterium]|nr:hypothetical protein [Patescibacteria group bacterium]
MNLNSGLNKIAQRYALAEKKKRELRELSAKLQKISKQIIFSLHRGKNDEAMKQSSEAEVLMKGGLSLIKKERLIEDEGAWRAATEEMLEANLFLNAVLGEDILDLEDRPEDPLIMIGALSDLIGELVRYSISCATNKNNAEIIRVAKIADKVFEMLLSLDATGYARTKVDQARQHIRKLEEIKYDLSFNV